LNKNQYIGAIDPRARYFAFVYPARLVSAEKEPEPVKAEKEAEVSPARPAETAATPNESFSHPNAVPESTPPGSPGWPAPTLTGTSAGPGSPTRANMVTFADTPAARAPSSPLGPFSSLKGVRSERVGKGNKQSISVFEALGEDAKEVSDLFHMLHTGGYVYVDENGKVVQLSAITISEDVALTHIGFEGPFAMRRSAVRQIETDEWHSVTVKEMRDIGAVKFMWLAPGSGYELHLDSSLPNGGFAYYFNTEGSGATVAYFVLQGTGMGNFTESQLKNVHLAADVARYLNDVHTSASPSLATNTDWYEFERTVMTHRPENVKDAMLFPRLNGWGLAFSRPLELAVRMHVNDVVSAMLESANHGLRGEMMPVLVPKEYEHEAGASLAKFLRTRVRYEHYTDNWMVPPKSARVAADAERARPVAAPSGSDLAVGATTGDIVGDGVAAVETAEYDETDLSAFAPAHLLHEAIRLTRHAPFDFNYRPPSSGASCAAFLLQPIAVRKLPDGNYPKVDEQPERDGPANVCEVDTGYSKVKLRLGGFEFIVKSTPNPIAVNAPQDAFLFAFVFPTTFGHGRDDVGRQQHDILPRGGFALLDNQKRLIALRAIVVSEKYFAKMNILSRTNAYYAQTAVVITKAEQEERDGCHASASDGDAVSESLVSRSELRPSSRLGTSSLSAMEDEPKQREDKQRDRFKAVDDGTSANTAYAARHCPFSGYELPKNDVEPGRWADASMVLRFSGPIKADAGFVKEWAKTADSWRVKDDSPQGDVKDSYETDPDATWVPIPQYRLPEAGNPVDESGRPRVFRVADNDDFDVEADAIDANDGDWNAMGEKEREEVVVAERKHYNMVIGTTADKVITDNALRKQMDELATGYKGQALPLRKLRQLFRKQNNVPDDLVADMDSLVKEDWQNMWVRRLIRHADNERPGAETYDVDYALREGDETDLGADDFQRDAQEFWKREIELLCDAPLSRKATVEQELVKKYRIPEGQAVGDASWSQKRRRELGRRVMRYFDTLQRSRDAVTDAWMVEQGGTIDAEIDAVCRDKCHPALDETTRVNWVESFAAELSPSFSDRTLGDASSSSLDDDDGQPPQSALMAAKVVLYGMVAGLPVGQIDNSGRCFGIVSLLKNLHPEAQRTPPHLIYGGPMGGDYHDMVWVPCGAHFSPYATPSWPCLPFGGLLCRRRKLLTVREDAILRNLSTDVDEVPEALLEKGGMTVATAKVVSAFISTQKDTRLTFATVLAIRRMAKRARDRMYEIHAQEAFDDIMYDYHIFSLLEASVPWDPWIVAPARSLFGRKLDSNPRTQIVKTLVKACLHPQRLSREDLRVFEFSTLPCLFDRFGLYTIGPAEDPCRSRFHDGTSLALLLQFDLRHIIDELQLLSKAPYRNHDVRIEKVISDSPENRLLLASPRDPMRASGLHMWVMDEWQLSLLHWSALSGMTETMRQLVSTEKGGLAWEVWNDYNAMGKEFRTPRMHLGPLHLASYVGWREGVHFLLYPKEQMGISCALPDRVQQLKRDLEHDNTHKSQVPFPSPVSIATLYGHVDVVEELLAAEDIVRDTWVPLHRDDEAEAPHNDKNYEDPKGAADFSQTTSAKADCYAIASGRLHALEHYHNSGGNLPGCAVADAAKIVKMLEEEERVAKKLWRTAFKSVATDTLLPLYVVILGTIYFGLLFADSKGHIDSSPPYWAYRAVVSAIVDNAGHADVSDVDSGLDALEHIGGTIASPPREVAVVGAVLVGRWITASTSCFASLSANTINFWAQHGPGANVSLLSAEEQRCYAPAGTGDFVVPEPGSLHHWNLTKKEDQKEFYTPPTNTRTYPFKKAWWQKVSGPAAAAAFFDKTNLESFVTGDTRGLAVFANFIVPAADRVVSALIFVEFLAAGAVSPSYDVIAFRPTFWPASPGKPDRGRTVVEVLLLLSLVYLWLKFFLGLFWESLYHERSRADDDDDKDRTAEELVQSSLYRLHNWTRSTPLYRQIKKDAYGLFIALFLIITIAMHATLHTRMRPVVARLTAALEAHDSVTYIHAYDSGIGLNYVRTAAAACLAVAAFGITSGLRYVPTMGPTAHAIFHTIISPQTIIFFFIFGVYLIGVTLGLHTLYGGTMWEFRSFSSSMLFSFLKVTGAELDFGDLDFQIRNEVATPLVLVIIIIFLQLTFLNILIAVISNEYEEQHKDAQEWWFRSIRDSLRTRMCIRHGEPRARGGLAVLRSIQAAAGLFVGSEKAEFTEYVTQDCGRFGGEMEYKMHVSKDKNEPFLRNHFM